MWNRKILFVLATVAVGCALPPKTVGMGTASDSDSDSGSESGSDDASSSAEGAEESMSTTAVSDTASGSSEGSSDDGTCVEEGCPWEPCAGAVCGTFCNFCPPWDEDCGEPGTYTVCAASGVCEVWPDWDVDACPGQGLQPGFEDTLAQSGGCGDMTVHAANDDETVALHLRVAGLVEEAHMTGGTLMREYPGDSAELDVEVTFGSELLVATCTDIAGNEPTVLEHWVPAAAEGGDAGTILVVIEPDLENAPNATATVTFTNVTLRRTDPGVFDPDLALDSLVVSDALVGWLPG